MFDLTIGLFAIDTGWKLKGLALLLLSADNEGVKYAVVAVGGGSSKSAEAARSGDSIFTGESEVRL